MFHDADRAGNLSPMASNPLESYSGGNTMIVKERNTRHLVFRTPDELGVFLIKAVHRPDSQKASSKLTTMPSTPHLQAIDII